MKFTVVLEPEPRGGCSVVRPALPCCVSQGRDLAAALANIREAILLCLEVWREDPLVPVLETPELIARESRECLEDRAAAGLPLTMDTGRIPMIRGRGIEGIPSLVVEVLSPSTAQLDRGPKAQLCARHLVPSYWIVDPGGRTIDAYALVEGTHRLAARLEGNEPEALPPFLDLTLDPAAICA